MNNLSLVSKPEEKSSEMKKPRLSKKERGPEVEIQALRIFKKTISKMDGLIEDSKKFGPSRIQARDLIHLAITKIGDDDLKKLREETATTEDRFQEQLREFQKTKPSATREEFLEHLLKKSAR